MVPILYDQYLHKSNLAAAISGLFSSSVGILCRIPTFPQRECAIFVVLKSHEQEEWGLWAKGLGQVFGVLRPELGNKCAVRGTLLPAQPLALSWSMLGGCAEEGTSVPQMRSLLPWDWCSVARKGKHTELRVVADALKTLQGVSPLSSWASGKFGGPQGWPWVPMCWAAQCHQKSTYESPYAGQLAQCHQESVCESLCIGQLAHCHQKSVYEFPCAGLLSIVR